MPFIVAGVLKKFIPNKPGQTAPAEDAGSGEIPPTPPAAKPFTVTPQTPVMEDIPPDKNNLSKDVAIKGTVKFVKEFVFDGNLEDSGPLHRNVIAGHPRRSRGIAQRLC